MKKMKTFLIIITFTFFTSKVSAEINSNINLPDGLPNINIVEANLLPDAVVEIVLVNTSPEYLVEIQHFRANGLPYFEKWKKKVIENIIVSLESEGKIISLPYEEKIETLPYNVKTPLRFKLLIDDIENIQVILSYLDRKVGKNIRLVKESKLILELANIDKGEEEENENIIPLGFNLKNKGKTTIEDIKMEVKYPYLWEAVVMPLSIKQQLFPEEERLIKITLKLPKNLSRDDYGDYLVEVNGIGYTLEKRKVEIPSKKMRIYLCESKSPPEITISNVMKTSDKEGNKVIRLTLTGGPEKRTKIRELYSSGESYFEVSFCKKMEDIYVSLMNESRIIAKPYEVKINSLDFDENKNIIFTLLPDCKGIKDVTVLLRYHNANIVKNIHMTQDKKQSELKIESNQFAQEGALGSNLVYELNIDATAGGAEGTFYLEVKNLPKEIEYHFTDPVTNARLTQIKITQEEPKTTLQKIQLILYLPEKLNPSLIEKSIYFYVVLSNKEEPKYSLKYPLELIPKGVGKLDILSSNFYYEVKPTQEAKIKIEVKNCGTLELKNIKIDITSPYEWRKNLTPEIIERIHPDKKQEVIISLVPPINVNVGEYEAKIKASCEVNNKEVKSPEKIVRINVKKEAKVGVNLTLIGIISLIMIAVVIFMIKITRR
ncbi:MAG: NEW3 domain-containing protein [bacterium]